MKICLIFFLLIGLLSCSQYDVRRAPANVTSTCAGLVEGIIVESNRFEKVGIEFEGTIDTKHLFTKEQLADKENYLSYANEYQYEVFDEVRDRLRQIIIDEYGDNKTFRMLEPSSWSGEISYMLNGEKYHWEVSREIVQYPEEKNLLPIEFASPILRSDADREFYIKALSKLKEVGIQADPDSGALQFHFDISKYNVGEIKKMLEGYSKVHDVLIDYLNGSKKRAKEMQYLIDNESVLLQAEELDQLAKDNTTLFRDIEPFSFNRGALRLASDKGTVEIRIFDSTISSLEIAKKYDLSQKLLKALLETDSGLSNFLREAPDEQVTIKKVFELINFLED